MNEQYIEDSDEGRHLRIPDAIIEEYLPHPEAYGEALVSLDNGMVTNIYKDDAGAVYSITNDRDLIGYVTLRQKLGYV